MIFNWFRSTKHTTVGDCLFCALDDPIKNQILIQNRTCYVRLDNYPATEGHVEIVPKRHVVSFFDLSAREVRDAYALIQAARFAIVERVRLTPEGFTIGINEGRAAGRTVDHLHIHLIPRHIGDVEDPRGGVRQIVPNCTPY